VPEVKIGDMAGCYDNEIDTKVLCTPSWLHQEIISTALLSNTTRYPSKQLNRVERLGSDSRKVKGYKAQRTILEQV
jgi:hypothetical protein